LPETNLIEKCRRARRVVVDVACAARCSVVFLGESISGSLNFSA
jgi:hypothetical protein